MKMIYKGTVSTPNEPNNDKQENALFWSMDGKHQVSMPCDSKLKKLCADLKVDQEVELDVGVKV